MRGLALARSGETLSVLCLGAHSDDIEIGAGGALLELIEAGERLDVLWCVVSATGARADEARASAEAFLDGVEGRRIELGGFEDGYFPYKGAEIKAWLAALRDGFSPDLIFTHRPEDAHQDHREVNQLTWNLFRDHLILEYEIPKWDGDLGRPNLYQPLKAATLDRKIALLHAHFGTQRSKDWFDGETFRGLSRLRGMECRAPEGYAEAFFMRKAILANATA
jgi:LmbE family N-acetylglucosaminyl deacetylase